MWWTRNQRAPTLAGGAQGETEAQPRNLDKVRWQLCPVLLKDRKARPTGGEGQPGGGGQGQTLEEGLLDSWCGVCGVWWKPPEGQRHQAGQTFLAFRRPSWLHAETGLEEIKTRRETR